MAAYIGVVQAADYTFAKGGAGVGTVTFSANYTGIALSDIMYITNVKTGVATVIYDPSDSTKGGTLAGLVLTLAISTSSMNNADTLQIIVGMNTLGLKTYVGSRIASTPTKTGGSALLSLQTCASGAVVIGSAIDVSTLWEMFVAIHLGRTATTALTNPAKIRIEASPETSGNDSWVSIAEFLSDTLASTTTATLTTATTAGATVLPMTTTAGILVGDMVYIQEAGGQTNSEFRRVITVTANTSITVEEGCTYAHTVTTTKVWSKANYWAARLNVAPYMRVRMVADCAYAASGQTIVAEGKYSTLTSIV